MWNRWHEKWKMLFGPQTYSLEQQIFCSFNTLAQALPTENIPRNLRPLNKYLLRLFKGIIAPRRFGPKANNLGIDETYIKSQECFKFCGGLLWYKLQQPDKKFGSCWYKITSQLNLKLTAFEGTKILSINRPKTSFVSKYILGAWN